MTDARTFAELNAEWHLGDDSIAAKARKALDDAEVTPAIAAAMTPKELANIPGIGTTRLARVKEQLRLRTEAWAKENKAAVLEAAKSQPGHCPDCGGVRATSPRAASSPTTADGPEPSAGTKTGPPSRAWPATSTTPTSLRHAPTNSQESDMPEPMKPTDVPEDLVGAGSAALQQLAIDRGHDGVTAPYVDAVEYVTTVLAAVLPLREQQIRQTIAAELARLATPCGTHHGPRAFASLCVYCQRHAALLGAHKLVLGAAPEGGGE